MSIMAYRLGVKTIFDWHVHNKTFSRSQDVTGPIGRYQPRDEQFEAIAALLKLSKPLPIGWHDYTRQPALSILNY